MKESDTFTDEKSIKLKLEKQIRMIIAIAGAVVVTTNFINTWVYRVSVLEEKHEYSIEAQKRRMKHAIEKQELIREKEWLAHELEECKKTTKL